MPRIISDLRELRFPGSFQGILRWPTRSAIRTIDLPDKSGTIALTSDVSSGFSYIASARVIANPFEIVYSSGSVGFVGGNRNSVGIYTLVFNANVVPFDYTVIPTTGAPMQAISDRTSTEFRIILRNAAGALTDFDFDVRVLP